MMRWAHCPRRAQCPQLGTLGKPLAPQSHHLSQAACSTDHWPALYFKACQMFSPAEHRAVIWPGRVQMGWCGCCDLSEWTCKHVLTEENCRAMLESSSWVGFTEQGNPFKCGPMDREGGSSVINSQRSALAFRKEACLEPLSLSVCSGKGHIFWVQRHQKNITFAFGLSSDMITGTLETQCLFLWSNLERIKVYFAQILYKPPPVCLNYHGWRKHIQQLPVRYGVYL